MYKFKWRDFDIKNIKDTPNTGIYLALLSSKIRNHTKMIDSIKKGLNLSLETHYNLNNYSIFNNKLITGFKFSIKEILDMLEKPIVYNDCLNYYEINEEILFYIKMKYANNEVENITNLKEIKVEYNV